MHTVKGAFHCQLQHCKTWALGSFQIARDCFVDPQWCKAWSSSAGSVIKCVLCFVLLTQTHSRSADGMHMPFAQYAHA